MPEESIRHDEYANNHNYGSSAGPSPSPTTGSGSGQSTVLSEFDFAGYK